MNKAIQQDPTMEEFMSDETDSMKPSSPAMTHCQPLGQIQFDDWLVGSFSKMEVSVRKRKHCETLSPRKQTNWLTVDGDRRRRMSKKSVRLSAEALRVVDLHLKVFVEDENDCLKKILEYLPDSELRRMSTVSSKWRGLCYTIRRERIRNSPFTLCWQSDEKLGADEVCRSIHCHFDPSWIAGDDETGLLAPVTTIISFGTSHFGLGLSDFDSVLPIRDGGTTFLFAASSQTVVTVPGSQNMSRDLVTTTNPNFALQSLCIPFDSSIHFLNMSIPISSGCNHLSTLAELQAHYLAARDILVASGRILKFYLCLQYCHDDILVNQFSDSYVSGSGCLPQQIGVIVAVVDDVFANKVFLKGRTIISTVLALHGLSTVQVNVFGFNVALNSLNRIRTLATNFFGSAVNVLIFLIYRRFVSTASLKELKTALGDMPLIGLRTDHPIAFQGTYISDSYLNPSEIQKSVQDSVELDVGVALAFIKY